MDLVKLFTDVFDPQPGERVLVLVDHPHGDISDNDDWATRRDMAAEWHAGFSELAVERGFTVLPLSSFPATGTHNGPLPLDADCGGPTLEARLTEATLAVALTEYSGSAPLYKWSKEHDDFRAASLPMVARRMEQTALAADYSEVARRCQVLLEPLTRATSARVRFSTGHEWHVDLRHRTPLMDNGSLPRDKEGDRVINLPSGETFQVPYEGDRDGDPSGTAGEIPVILSGEQLVLRVEGNRIVGVDGPEALSTRWTSFFEEEPARANIAEFAFGCNPEAVVWGNVLEDEKAGFHWAYGRSDHLGGTVGVDAFSGPDQVIHQDIVYAKDSPISIARAVLVDEAGGETLIIEDGEYVLFG